MKEQEQIVYMQTRILRLASERWKMEMQDLMKLFLQFDALHYIEENFGLFHIEGDEAILEDVVQYLKTKGAVIHAEVE